MAERGELVWWPATWPVWRRARRWAALGRQVALPLLLIALLAALDLVTTPEFIYLPLLSLGPAFAATRAAPAAVAVTGCVGVTLWYPMVRNDGLSGTFQGYVALATIAGATLAGVAVSIARERRERELADVRAVAEVAEQVLLRRAPSRVGQFQIATRYLSAATSARIGGDLYDVVPAGRTLRLLVGDVQGKGLPAVRTASIVLGAFRESAYDAPSLVDIARRIEASLERQAAVEEFVTAVLAQVRTDGSDVEILSCGHPPPLLLHGDGASFAEPAQACLPLGMADVGEFPREGFAVPFHPGDQLLFYTDGVSEARDGAGRFYPLERRHALLGSPEPQAALARLSADVIRHAGGTVQDDAAMLLLRRSGGDRPDPPR